MLPEEASDAISNLTASDRASSVASTLALLVFVQIGGVTALAPVIARTLVHWTMPPLWLFLFGVSGFVVSLTCALVMRRAVLRMMQSAIGSAETTSTTLLHAMVERIPQGVALWDHDNRLVLCNQIYRDVFSRIDDHLVAGAHLDNVANTELNAAYFPVSAVPSWFENRKQNHWIGDISERRKIDGCEYEIVDYHCDDDGGTVTLISDISDLKIKEEQLRDAQERYALVSLASTEGLWDMDLRTGRFYVAPPGVVDYWSQGDPIGFRREDWVAAIHPEDQDSYHLGWQEHLDGDSRIFDQQYRVCHASGELRWISDRALALRDSSGHAYRIAGSVSGITMIAEKAATKGLVVVASRPDGLPDLIGDQSKIKQMLLNLLTNAISFTPTGAEIEIGVEFNNGHGLDLSVRDSGIGMSEPELERARLSFSQTSDSPSRQHGGLGLGLAITTALAELHGGALILTSQLDVGTKATAHFSATRIQ
jgi:PAS domain-containing protein|tara:strand:- start:292 stop:1731 length:1440 start_codon:yes stop_codon:yes gene_type:complete